MNILEVFNYNQHFVAMMNIINNARLNPPAKGHKHHIIPRCWFKLNNIPTDNSKDNLVLLTPEDHLKVHILSILCAIDDVMKSKMGFAVKRLKCGNFSGMKHTKDTIELIKAKRALQVITDEHKKHISDGLKGKSKPYRTNYQKAQKSLSEAFHKYKDEGGELKWRDWLHKRKEVK